MEQILQFISNHATTIIVLSGIAVAAGLMWIGVKLDNHKTKIKEALTRRNRRYVANADTREIEENEDQDAAITPDTIRKYEMEFNRTCSWHGMLTQLIPIFPLLGILGTVAGLMLETKAGDMTVMLGSLDVALVTTFWGLIFAILLKIIEAVFPSRVIYDVEVMLDDFDKKMSLAEMFQNYRAQQ